MGKGNAPAQILAEIGGVGGALAKEADRVYDSLSELQKEIAQRLFIALLQLGGENKVTRRRVKISSLITRADDAELFRQVVWRFAAHDVRLITVSAEGDEETAELTHEALFENWQQLQTWLESNWDDIRFQQRLEEAAQYWKEQKQPAGLLWRRPDLDLLRNYHKRLNQQMSDLELDFFQAAVGRENRQKFLQVGAVSSLAIFLTGMTWFGIQSYRLEQRALARRLAAQAEQLLNQTSITQKEAGALLAVKSFVPLQGWQKESGDVNQVLRRALNTIPLATLNHEGAVEAVSFSHDGKWVATASIDKTARVWDTQTGELIAILNHQGWVNSVSFSPDGQRVATASRDQTARIWDTQTGELLATLNHYGVVNAVSFSPDGQRVATASAYGISQVWDVQTGELITSLNHHAFFFGIVNAVSFSPNGQLVATASKDNTARVWDAQTGKSISIFNHNAEVKYGKL